MVQSGGKSEGEKGKRGLITGGVKGKEGSIQTLRVESEKRKNNLWERRDVRRDIIIALCAEREKEKGILVIRLQGVRS